jgi:hypothetical protein
MRAIKAHPSRLPKRLLRSYAVVFVLSAVAACSTSPPAQTTLMSTAPNIEMSTVELRLRVYGFAEEFVNGIVRAADRILESTEDVGISRNALRWKINAMITAQLTAFSLDPLAAFYDMWALAIQMRQFIESGAGKDAFGHHQPIALETVRGLEDRAYEFAASISMTGEVPDSIRREVEAYAAAHPLTDMSLVRGTATDEFASELAGDRTSGLAALGDLNVQVGDLTERMKYYAASLPAQFRWQSELLFLDIISDDQINEFLDDVETVGEAAERLAVLADSVPALVDAQARAAIGAMSIEVASSLREVDRQRLETLDALTAERIAVMEGLTAERLAVMEQLAAMTDGTVGRVPVAFEGVVDYAFRRSLVLLVLIFAGGLVFAFLLRLIWKRPAAV